MTGHTTYSPEEMPSSAWISLANCDWRPCAAIWKFSPHLTGQCHGWRALHNLGQGLGSAQWTSHLVSGMLAKKGAESSRCSDVLSPSHPHTICAWELRGCQGWGKFPCPGTLQVGDKRFKHCNRLETSVHTKTFIHRETFYTRKNYTRKLSHTSKILTISVPLPNPISTLNHLLYLSTLKRSKTTVRSQNRIWITYSLAVWPGCMYCTICGLNRWRRPQWQWGCTSWKYHSGVPEIPKQSQPVWNVWGPPKEWFPVTIKANLISQALYFSHASTLQWCWHYRGVQIPCVWQSMTISQQNKPKTYLHYKIGRPLLQHTPQ